MKVSRLATTGAPFSKETEKTQSRNIYTHCRLAFIHFRKLNSFCFMYFVPHSQIQNTQIIWVLSWL